MAVMVAAFWTKDRCFNDADDPDPTVGNPECYADITYLYPRRGFSQGLYPYAHGDGAVDVAGDAIGDGDFEYPPATGLIVAAGVAVSDDARGFLRSQALLITLIAGIGIAALWTNIEQRWRVLLILLTPIAVRYSFFNWDWPPVAAVCLGIIAMVRGRDATAGVLLGVGAAAKVFPGLLVPVAAWWAWRSRGPRASATVLIASVGTFVVFCVPVALLDRESFLEIWSFHGDRPAHHDSLLSLIYRAATGAAWREAPPMNEWLVLAMVGGFLMFGWIVRLRARRGDPLEPVGIACAVLLWWILAGKVFSPQYALWGLPVFALIRLPWWSWLAYVGIDLVGFWAISPGGGRSGWTPLFEAITLGRSVVLAGLIWLVLHRPSNVRASASIPAHV